MRQVSGILSICPLFLYSMHFLPVKESEVWRTAEDPASTPALEYSWAASSIYSILLAILNIDTRIVVWTVSPGGGVEDPKLFLSGSGFGINFCSDFNPS